MMQTLQSRFLHAAFILLLTTLSFSSCSDEEILPDKVNKTEVPEPVVNEAHQYVNSWILENMRYWYLWSDKLPRTTDKNLDPESFFNSLLHTEDRFSWIQSNFSELVNSLQGISREAGYEFVLYREKEGSDKVVMQVVYTKPNSPAATAGLKRGDLITHINGQSLTVGNYQALLADIKTNHTVQYKSILPGRETFGDPQTRTLSTVQYAENPNYLHKVIKAGERKIGYFVYNFFAAGTDDNPGAYDAEMDAIFAGFKAEGITDLVLDLRFNSGGSEGSARNLASLIGSGVDQTKIFLKRQYNDNVQQAIRNEDPDHLVSHFRTKANNVGSQLASGRVYILTSSRTASASELIINALKPFMEVFLIGDTTYGKNVGSISLYEESDPRNTWGLQPIVVKVYNSLDQSDYGTGFVPDVLHKDNSLFLHPLGDPSEPLLALAIGQITGTATIARTDRAVRTPIGHSLDRKRRSFNLIMDESRHQ